MIRTLRPVALGLLVASLALCGAALPGPAAAGEPVYPTGLKIGLAPAPGLRVAEKFPGFEDKETGATVLMLEVAPPALAETAKQLGRDSLKKQGIVEQRRESFPAGSKGTLVAGRQEGDGRTVRKWILLAPAGDTGALVVVQVPEEAAKSYPEAAVRDMLASVRQRADVPIEEQLELLPIRLDERSGMRPIRVLGSNGALLTDGPKDTLEAVEQPLLIVSVGRGGPEENAARDTFARNLLAGFGAYKDVRIVGTEMLRLGGGGAHTHQVMAEAKDPKTDAPLKLVQWVRFGSGAYLRILGAARDDAWSEAFPRFRAVRDGVNPRG
ncbi:hypothetical protein GJ689_18145 [Rhodoplanes serenus]|uniref:Uncharacterized protein n=1 Tax=Rhodoplanes serenus TaxID=200615 RepID=A0A447CTY3_9BRAD|nr:hypothetical protein [Rhodoplanes serenus]MTW18124.1 hypothetical protein [Rhodoplanes serenus]VCU08617.1 hypothetical protein RHODGE_RHODGE_01782 [Rhodoplanes serenus]